MLRITECSSYFSTNSVAGPLISSSSFFIQHVEEDSLSNGILCKYSIYEKVPIRILSQCSINYYCYLHGKVLLDESLVRC